MRFQPKSFRSEQNSVSTPTMFEGSIMTKIGKNLLQSVYEVSSSFPNSAASHKLTTISSDSISHVICCYTRFDTQTIAKQMVTIYRKDHVGY